MQVSTILREFTGMTTISVVTTGAIRRAKLQSNRHHQKTNTQFFTGRIAVLMPNQQCQSTDGSNNNTKIIITIISRWDYSPLLMLLLTVPLLPFSTKHQDKLYTKQHWNFKITLGTSIRQIGI